MLKSLLIKFAPTLAFALGGPFASAATKIVLHELDLKPGATDDEVAEALATASPDVKKRLKEAEYRFKAQMKELDIDVFKLEVADRDSARRLAAANGGLVQAMLAALVISGYSAFVVAMFIKPDLENQILLAAYGTLATAFGTVLGFYFGTTKSSSEKNAIIANQRR